MFVDSNCDLPRELLAKMPVECINFPCILNGEIVRFDKVYDGLGFTPNMLKLEPTSPSVDDYVEVFRQGFYRGDDIVYLYTSKKIFDTKNLSEAISVLKNEFPKRKLLAIDTCNFSIGQGLVSYALAMKYRAGATLEELEEMSKSIKEEYQVFLSLDSLDTLNHNGVLLGSQMAGGALRVRPVVTINESGDFALFDKVSGKKKSMLKLVEYIREYGANVVDFPIAIVYSDDDTLANELKSTLVREFGDEAYIMLSRFSPNNRSLIGGGIGVCFHVKKKN